MGKKQALCTKNDEEITGVLLFSRNRNMICCLAVSPEHRREGIASKLLEKALDELDRNRDITVSTFREDDEKGVAPRSLYRKFGFREGELTVEFDYPNQVFVLKGNGSISEHCGFEYPNKTDQDMTAFIYSLKEQKQTEG